LRTNQERRRLTPGRLRQRRGSYANVLDVRGNNSQVKMSNAPDGYMAAARQLRQHIRAGVLHLGCDCEVVLEYQVW